MNFKLFYQNGSNQIDMLRTKTTKDFMSWDDKTYFSKIKRMPIKYLTESHGDFFSYKDEVFYISNDLEQYMNNTTFIKHIEDAINMRVKQYYRNRKLTLKGDKI